MAKASGAQTASAGEAARVRNILLFSDGTGNSSAKLQKTNVWRLYEALDLGEASGPGKIEQIAYYDNGVGTSSFKLLAVLGGVFGFGLGRNVQDIYKFLCRNYREGDRIYAFGFSRGAFTIRLVVAMIVLYGIIASKGESDLDLQARDVWRSFRGRRPSNRRLAYWVVALVRFIGPALVNLKRAVLGQRRFAEAIPDHLRKDPDSKLEAGPPIEFVGVWDTVAAYGGPIVEITRGIDLLIWPLTMNDYHLSAKVKCARHALAIDDKREAFTLLPWDEVHEESLVRDKKVPAGRLLQVWFCGMHSDVGGGYSDESLSFVSLDWMIGHAEKAGARLLAEPRKRIGDMANPFGPINDSRAGFGMFYRYQPRYIAAWLEHPSQGSRTYRDPGIGGVYRHNGMLKSPIRLHESVVARLREGTNDYGPVNLPEDYLIESAVGKPTSKPFVTRQYRPWLAELGDRIKQRRLWFSISFLLVLLLLAKPWWQLGDSHDARIFLYPVESAINAFLPAFAERWTHAWAQGPLASLVLVLAIALTVSIGTGVERRMSDVAHAVWGNRLNGHPLPPAASASWLRWLHRKGPVNSVLAFLKWALLPILAGCALIAGVAYAFAALVTQVSLWLWLEQQPGLCTKGPPPDGKYQLSSPCSDMGIQVKRGTTYLVSIKPHDWKDQDHPASPLGWLDHEGKPYTPAAYVPLFRVVNAPIFAPVFEVRGDSWTVEMHRPNLVKLPDGSWFGEFTPGESGRLHFFVNDVVLPVDPGMSVEHSVDGKRRGWSFFDISGRYHNNFGTAEVEVTQGNAPSEIERAIAEHRRVMHKPPN